MCLKKEEICLKEWAIFKTTFISVMIISLIQLYTICIFIVNVGYMVKNQRFTCLIVNNIKEASYNGQTMTIGEDMVSNLKKIRL